MNKQGQKKSFWNWLKGGNAATKSMPIQTGEINPSTYSSGAMFHWLPDGTEVSFTYQDGLNAHKAYTECPPVAAIINRKAQAYINGKTWVMRKQGKGKDKEANSAEAIKIKNRLASPNPLQSWKQFEAQGYIYLQVYSYNVLLPVIPVGFEKKGAIEATALWNITPFCRIEEQKVNNVIGIKDAKDLIKSVHFVYNGQETALNVEDLIIQKDTSPSFCSLLLPQSRLLALQKPINNIIAAYESRNVLINKRGPMYVISSNKSDESGNIPMRPDEKDQIEKDFAKYGLRKNQVQGIITNANISLTTVGFATKDLMLFEEIEDDIMRICDSYGYPYELLSSAKGTTFANKSESKKLLYQDTIIPEAESIYEQWNSLFKASDYGLNIEKDYSHVPALQEDEKSKAEARKIRNEAMKIEWENNLITLDEWREANGDDALPDGKGKVYYREVQQEQMQAQQQNSTDNNNNNAGEI